MKWIKELRSTEKGRALFKLMLYMLFLFFVIVLCIVAGAMGDSETSLDKENSGTDESSENRIDNVTYFQKQEELIKGKYKFEYTIETGSLKISFTGEYDNGQIDGFRETSDELIHYSVLDGKVYKLEGDIKTEFLSLYENLNSSYFDIANLFLSLNRSSANIEKIEGNKVYNYNIDSTDYRVITSDLFIEEIDITSGSDKYVFKYKFEGGK